jgi:hypothetical protein
MVKEKLNAKAQRRKDLLLFFASLRLCVSILFFPFVAFAQDVKVEATLDSRTLSEQRTIEGTVSVTHAKNEQVETSSFRMNDKSLPVEWKNDVAFPTEAGKELLISHYGFKMPGLPLGLHELHPISVDVGGTNYQSIPSTFEVKPVEKLSETTQEAYLKLKANVPTTTNFYPGQEIDLGYTFLYRGDIDLQEESLPLLEPPGFKKVGDLSIENSEKGGVSVTTISQRLKAEKGGEYQIGQSVIAGHAYTINAQGQKTYIQPELKSVVDPIKFIINPFPIQLRPPSFNGAVGQFKLSVKMTTPQAVNVGDKINLLIEVSGKGQMDTVQPPDLCCQPGFSGIFWSSDLPPVLQQTGTTKGFIIELRPLNPLPKEIPSIQFSYFDPEQEKYVTLQSSPIPIKINPIKAASQPLKEKEYTAVVLDHHPKTFDIKPDEKTGPSDLVNRPFGTWQVLWLIPVGVYLVLLQIFLKRYLQARKEKIPPKTGYQWFKDAEQSIDDAKRFYFYLYKALAALPHDKAATFIQDLESRRFTGGPDLPRKQVLKEAKALFFFQN